MRRTDRYAQKRDEMALDEEVWREKYHQQLKKKTAAFRRLQAEEERAVEREEERLTQHFVKMREQQLAAAASRWEAHKRRAKTHRRCKPIVPPPRKPPPTSARKTAPATASTRGRTPASTPHHCIYTPDGGETSGSPRARGHGVLHPELEPMEIPGVHSLDALLPNRMADAQFLAELSTSEEEKADILRRVQHTDADAKAAVLALEEDAAERKRRATMRMMATRAAEIKQATKATAEQLNLRLRAEPGLASGPQRFPTIAT